MASAHEFVISKNDHFGGGEELDQHAFSEPEFWSENLMDSAN